MYWVRRGHRFNAVTVADVEAGKLPEDLKKLREGAEKVSHPESGKGNGLEDGGVQQKPEEGGNGGS